MSQTHNISLKDWALLLSIFLVLLSCDNSVTSMVDEPQDATIDTDTDVSPDGFVMDSSVTDGSVTDGSVTDGSVTDGSVTDGSVTDGSVTDGSVTDGSVSETCEDGLQNGAESDVDCGGICPGCVAGDACDSAADCQSQVCVGGTCIAARCDDGVQNQTEIGPDCGGECAPCDVGLDCDESTDCLSGVCVDGSCDEASCMDGVHNGSESGVDCGGGCGPCEVALCDTSPICVQGFRSITDWERRFRIARGFRVQDLVMDRHVYFADDPVALVMLRIFGEEMSQTGQFIRLELLRDEEIVATVDTASVDTPKLEVHLDMERLEIGDYMLVASLHDDETTVRRRVERSFQRTSERDAIITFPSEGIPIELNRVSTIEDGDHPITTGVPMPLGALDDVSRLALYEDGRPIPAQFIARSHWHRGGSVRWVGVDFQARVRGGVIPTYTLRRLAAPQAERPRSTLSVTEDAELIMIDTGVARFQIRARGFNGIAGAWLDRDGDGVYGEGERVLSGRGGPYLVDQTGTVFSAENDDSAEVTVEEQGDARVTVHARGWYRDTEGNGLCRFETRLSAYAGQPYLQVDHVSIITYETRGETRIADLGWHIAPSFTLNERAFGADDQVLRGAPPTEGETFFLHQDRGDRYRIGDGTTFAEGRRSDGWMQVRGDTLGASVVLRDIYQKYPAELEVLNDSSAPRPDSGDFTPRMALHLWPRHGREAYSEEEQLTTSNLYRLFPLHQGAALDFNLPETHVDALSEACGLSCTSGEASHISSAQEGNAQGVAISGQFRVVLHANDTMAEEASRHAEALQDPVHALASPSWNTASLVEGHISARDPNSFPKYERQTDLAQPSYLREIVERHEQYGRWIYGAFHNQWNMRDGVPALHRIWQHSHYRNVHQALLLYFRGGQAAQRRWARINSDRFLDIGTINHDKENRAATGAEGANRFDVTGTHHHAKGLVPWGSDVPNIPNADNFGSAGNHWTDVGAPLLRYYLFGDRRALDLAQAWREVALLAGNQSGVWSYETCEDNYQRSSQSREWFTYLGEALRSYQHEPSVELLSIIHDVAVYYGYGRLSCFQYRAGYPVFHRLWFDLYHRVTRDPRIVETMKTYWEEFASEHYYQEDYVTLAAFLARVEGDPSYLDVITPIAHDRVHMIFDRPNEPYHGLGELISSRIAGLSDRAYLTEQLARRGRGLDAGERPMSYLNRGGRRRQAWWSHPHTPWPSAGTILLSQLTAGDAWQLRLRGLQYKNDHVVQGGYRLLTAAPLTPEALSDERAQLDFTDEGIFDSPRCPDTSSCLSIVRAVPGDFCLCPREPEYYSTPLIFDLPVNRTGIHQLLVAELRSVGTENPDRVSMRAPYGSFADNPMTRPAEAMVMSRRQNLVPGDDDSDDLFNRYRAFFRTSLYARPISSTQGTTLRFTAPSSSAGFSSQLIYVRITDSDGAIIAEESLWGNTEHESLDVRLDPSVNPIPWHIFMVSNSLGASVMLADPLVHDDPEATLRMLLTEGQIMDGPEELLWGITPDDVNLIATDLELSNSP